VPLERLEATAAGSGLKLERVRHPESQFTLVLGRRQ
jgi:hypothetical protein